MNRAIISQRITSILAEIERLNNALYAMNTTDIQRYPDNYEVLSTDAALRAERITCRLRHLIYATTSIKKEEYLRSAETMQGIEISENDGILEIKLPCLLPKRRQRQSTEFLLDPFTSALSDYAAHHTMPQFQHCVVCFSHIYAQELPERRIGEVYQLIAASSEQELNALFGVLPVTHPAKAPYSIFKQASEGVRGGVIIGLGSRLQVFQNRDIRNITSYNEIDLELPGKQPCAYYCITSDQDSTFDFLSSLFLSFVFIRLVRYADEHCPGGELPVPVHVLGEELCACGVIPDLSRKISVIRSRNLSMSCVFQNLAGLQNRYPYNQWQEILGNCDVQLFLGCTDALTAEFISDRTGETSISVTSKAKQLGTWRVSNYTPEYRETSGVGRRKLMTMDEVLRMDIDKALILIRGKNVLEVDKYDYSKHPEAKKLRSSKAASHVPAWRANQPQEKQTPSAPPSQAADKKPAQKKKPASAEKVVAVTKESIMKKKEDT